MDGQPSAMTQTPVGARVHETPDIRIYLTAQTTFNFVIGLNNGTQLAHLFFGQRMGARVRFNPCLFYNLAGHGLADPVDVGESNLEPLISGQIYACNTCQ
jgi:hypothetical protein